MLNDIVSAAATNIFNNRLDKFWVNQVLKFDYKAEITRIGSRSLKCI